MATYTCLGSEYQDQPVQMTTQVAKITFDGGARPTNPGNGYGSWNIVLDGKDFASQAEVEHGPNLTNNQAEYLTLIHALNYLVATHGYTKTIRLDIWSDSKLVVNQLIGVWKCKHPNMIELRDRALETIIWFGCWDIRWHSRVESVALFGH